MVEIVVPELHEMRTAHLVSIGSEFLNALNPYCEDGYVSFWVIYTGRGRNILLSGEVSANLYNIKVKVNVDIIYTKTSIS